MNEVSWKVVDISPENNVIVEYTDGVNENTVWYKWEGDIDAIKNRIESDAINYRDIWWKVYPLNLFHKQDLLAISGTTSANTV